VPTPVVVGLVVGVVLSVATIYAARRQADGAMSSPVAALLVVLGLAWQQANHSIEGVILWTVTPTHGLVLADLLGAPAAALVIAHALSFLVPQRSLARA
jgi:hypothetical protein